MSTVLASVTAVSCSSGIRYSSSGKSRHISDTTEIGIREGSVITGTSSYYGPKFHGRPTASGEIFDMYKMTAAHRTLPFGTIAEVLNLENGLKTVVRINDRGPFKKNRILDLSFAAAQKIGLIKNGTARVQIKILKLGNKNK